MFTDETFEQILEDAVECLFEHAYKEKQGSYEVLRGKAIKRLYVLKKKLRSMDHFHKREFVDDCATMYGYTDFLKNYDYETHTYHRRERDPMFSLTDDDK
jgi:hypothetical protein